MNVRAREYLCIYDWAVLVALAYDKLEYNIDRKLNDGRFMSTILYPDHEYENVIFVTAYFSRQALEGLTENPPRLYPEGMEFTRTTVPFPDRQDNDVTQCAILRTMWTILQKGGDDIDTAPQQRWEHKSRKTYQSDQTEESV
ncbi:hypothetical protein BDQ17DRAFT_1337208 [Cyathus striatus]|nr:hypothetical protein BDQ17DRAFT_1337208 [Cyathus striatus]